MQAASTDRIRVACLGAGYFSRFHYDAWRRIDEVELIGSADLSLDRAASTGLPAHEDLHSLLQAGVPDILDIITKPDTHLAAIRQALSAGVSTIICQKPFCESREQAAQAVDLARQAGARLVVHENFRFQPWYRCMARAVEQGQIGQVHQLSFRLRPGDGQGADAYLDRQPYFREMPRLLIHETGVHFIDVFRYLLGKPVAVYADLRRLNPHIAGEDAGYFVFDFGNGARALFDGNRHLDHAADDRRLTMGECLLEGDRGTLMLAGNGEVALRRFGSCKTDVLLPADHWRGFGGDCVHALQQHVVDALAGRGEMENEAADYLAVMDLEQAVYQSAETGRRVLLDAVSSIAG